MKRATAAAALLVALMIGAAACGGGKSATQKAVDKATNGKVKVNDNGGITVKGNGGDLNLGGSQLPTDFPKSDVPVPSGGTLVASAYNTQDGKKSWILTYTVKGGDAASVVSDYQSALTGAGYHVNGSSSGGAGGSSFQTFTAVGTKYDVSVMGGSGAGTGSDAGFVVTVQTHDTSNDTTPSSDSSSSDSTSTTSG